MALVNITGTLVLPDGSNAANRNIVIRKAWRQAEEDSGDVVLHDDIMVSTDASGAVNFSLYDGEYVALYAWDFDVRKYFKFYVPDVAGPLLFNDLIPYPLPPNVKYEYYTKRGDTLRFGCVYLDGNGVVQSLSGITVIAAMEHEATGLRRDFSTTIVDEAAGRFDLNLGSGQTDGLDLGWYNFDIEFTNGLIVSHTMTGRIKILEEIT